MNEKYYKILKITNSLDPDPGYKLFDTQIVFLKEFFVNVDFEKFSRRKKHACVTSKASDQPAHMRSLISAFASRLNIL